MTSYNLHDVIILIISRHNDMIKNTNLIYLFFFQSLLISSSVFPLVSGTQRQTKRAAATQMIPYKLYANIGLKSYNAGKVEDTM